MGYRQKAFWDYTRQGVVRGRNKGGGREETSGGKERGKGMKGASRVNGQLVITFVCPCPESGHCSPSCPLIKINF